MEQFVNHASAAAVKDGVRVIKQQLVIHSQLIDPANPLLVSAKTAINRHISGHTLIPTDAINSYLASSMLLHSLDGWSYLSRAIESLLKGDERIAIHLAYYSELRAAMSFLTSEGIGIFNHHYISVDNTFNVEKNPSNDRITGAGILEGTHRFIWNAMDKWIKSISKPTTADDLYSIFSVEGKTFKAWIDNFPYASPVASVVILKRWLSDWNFEVSYFSEDRDARNFASYQPPQQHPNPNIASLNENIEKLYSFWSVIEPSGRNRFQKLDQYLLRDLLRKIYNSFSEPVKAANSFESLIKKCMINMGLSPLTSLINFLTATDDHNIFLESLNTARIAATNTLNPISVIARATLMLRIASGNSSYLFEQGGVTKTELDFLWETYGVRNGFWATGTGPSDFLDLWDDIKDNLEEVYDWANTRSPGLDLSTVFNDPAIPSSLNYFSQINRAGLWGIALT